MGSRRGRHVAPVPDAYRKAPKPVVREFADLMRRELPPVRWTVPGILPEGVTLLAGKAKVRKSWFALGLCLAVAGGGVALGKIPVERGETLYAALEDNERRLQSRGRKVLGGLADGLAERAPRGFYYATSWPRLDEGGTEALAEWLDEHPDCRLVVLDTLAKVRPRPRGSSGGYQEDYEALENLLPLAAERHVAILVVTHTRKAAASDVLDEINATTGLMGGVDGFLVFRVERGKNEATVHVDGRDIEEPGELALKWDRHIHGWTLTGNAEETRLTEQRRAILDALREAGEPMGPKAIAKAAGLVYGTVRNLLGALAVDGRIENVGRGAWQLATPDLSPTLTGDDNGDDKGNPHGNAENPRLSRMSSMSSGGDVTPITRDAHDNDDIDDKGGVRPIGKPDALSSGDVIDGGGDDNGWRGGDDWHDHPLDCECPECS